MSDSRTRVAIIGGGIAGMSAALALSEYRNQFDVTMYESKRYTGGRAGSFVDEQTGQSVDYCQHVAMGCCTNLLSMMSDAGISSPFVRYRELAFHHPNHPPSKFAKSAILPAPFHLLPSLFGLRYLTWRQRCEISWATAGLMRSKRKRLAAIAARHWLVSKGQSEATIRDYWDIVIASALGETSDRVSMAAAQKVFVDGFLACREASDVLVPTLPLSELFGEVLPRVIENRGVQIRKGTKVGAVRATEDRKMVVDVETESVRFDHVIIAAPWFSLAKLLSSETAIQAGLPADRFASVPCSPISGIHLWFDRPVMDQPHAVFVGTMSQWVFRRSENDDANNKAYVQVVVSASHDLRKLDASEVIATVVAEIFNAFPAARAAKLMKGRVVTDPQSVFSLSPAVDAIRPKSSTALHCLHLAGDFVQTGWPATMEGAVISGRVAASSVLEQTGYQALVIDSGLSRSWLSRLLIRPV